ncbi:MAG: PqqD family peptide modification chaperone [Candidatus Odinarchaeota archaeon]
MPVFVKRHSIAKIAGNEFIIVNGVTGAIDILSRDGYDQIELFKQTSDINVLDEPLYKHLMQRGYLLDSSDRENKLIEDIYRRVQDSMSKHRILESLIIPSYACNLRCVYCFEGSIKEKRSRLGRNSVDSIFAFFDSLINSSCSFTDSIRVSFYGGEPILLGTVPVVLDIMKRLRSRYPDKEVTFNAITNGTVIARFANQLKRHGLVDVQITLDGPRPVHNRRRPYTGGKGSYDDVIEGISACLNNGIRVSLRINVDLENINTLPDLTVEIQDRWQKAIHEGMLRPYIGIIQEPSCAGYEPAVKHADKITDLLLKMAISSPEVFKTIKIDSMAFIQFLKPPIFQGKLAQPKIHYCGAIHNAVVLDPEGSIYTCWGVVGDKKQIVGTYHPEIKFWKDSLECWLNRDMMNIEECYQCPVALICAGGCASHALSAYGDIRRPYCHSISSLEKASNLLLQIREIERNQSGDELGAGKKTALIRRIVKDRDLWVKIQIHSETEPHQEFIVLPSPLTGDEGTNSRPVSFNETLYLNPNLSFTEDGDSAHITGFGRQGYVYQELNETAAVILKQFQKKERVSEVLRVLAEEFSTSEEEIKKDVIQCIRDFIRFDVLIRQ